MRVDSRIRPCVGSRVTGDWIVFAVEFSGPLIVGRLAVGISAINGHHHLIAHRLVHNLSVLRRSGRDLGLGFVQFPCADIRVGREAHCGARKAHD